MNRPHDAIFRRSWSLYAGLILIMVASQSASLAASDWFPPPPPAPISSELLSTSSRLSTRNQWETPSDAPMLDAPNGASQGVGRKSEFLVRQITNSGLFRMPGEFEHQQALMISCREIYSSDAILDVVRVLHGRVAIVALYSDAAEYRAARAMLYDLRIPADSIHFVHVLHNTRWARDYGPIALASKRDRQIALADSLYTEVERADDEVVPLALAESARLPLVNTHLRMDGGNLISNGQGLVITTTESLTDNDGLDQPTVARLLKDCYGASQLVFLEPLQNESTGHVDMFATFTSPDCVVIGQYDPRDDYTNANVLDRNAKRLAQVHLPTGRLKVRRIPMPTNGDGIWRTYTNVAYVNGMLLMPVYSNTPLDSQQRAVAIYRTLLPNWSIALINADDLIAEGGALHCAIMNLGPLSAKRLGMGTRSVRRVVLNW